MTEEQSRSPSSHRQDEDRPSLVSEDASSGLDPARDPEFRRRMVESLDELEFDEGEVGDLEQYIPSPPDGGWGWVIVLASFVANFVIDGIAYGFGVFLTEFQHEFGAPQGVVAIVGSLLTGTYLLVGPVVGGLVNQWGARTVMMLGSVIGSTAFFLSVYSPSITFLMFIYGIVGGIGFGLIYLPAIVTVGLYFEKRRSLATGLALAGSGVGTFVFAPLSVTLIEALGWKGSQWILAGLILNCAVCGALLRPIKPMMDPAVLQQDIIEEGEKLRSTLSNLALEGGGSVLSIDSSGLVRLRNRTLSVGSNQGVTRPLRSKTDPHEPETTPDGKLGPDTGSIPELSTQNSATTPIGQLSTLREGEPLVERMVSSPTGSPERRAAEAKKNRVRNSYSTTSYQSHTSGPNNFKSSQTTVGTLSPKVSRPPSRHLSRISAASYASSIGRLPALPGSLAANSLSTLATIRSGDLTRPMSRQDIFYTGSVVHLDAYKQSQGNLSQYRQSTISLAPGPATEQIMIDGMPVVYSKDEYDDFATGAIGLCAWIPRPVRNVLMEMLALDLLKNPFMALLCLSNVFGMLGFYSPFVYIAPKAEEDAGADKASAAFLLSIIGVTNTIGRVVFGWISDQHWLSALAINNICLAACALLTLLLPLFTSYASLQCYAALFGFMVSAYISLTSIILVDYLGLESLSNSFGLVILARGLSALVGSPIGGLVYDRTQSYNMSFLYSGVMFALACAVSSLIHLLPPHDCSCLRKKVLLNKSG